MAITTSHKGWTNSYISKLISELSTGRPFIELQDHAYKQDQQFYDKLELDPQIRAATEHVATDIAGIDWNLTSDLDSDMIPIYRDGLKCIRLFTSARVVIAKNTLMRGFSVSKILWGREFKRFGRDSRARRWIVPKRILDQGCDRVRRSAEPIPGDVSGAKMWRWNFWDHQTRLWKQLTPDEEWKYVWSVYLPEESTLGYGNGVGRALYYLYRLKVVMLELIAGFAERSVDSWIILKLEQLANTDNLYDDPKAVDALIEIVEKMRAAGILAVTGESEVTTLNPSHQSWQLMTEMIDKIDRQILVLIKGTNLDTEMDGGGSFAAAKTHQEVSNKRLVLQRETIIAEPMSDWLIPAFYQMNRQNFRAMGREVHELPTYNVSGGEVFNAQERLPIFQDAFDRQIPVAMKDYREQMGLSQVEPGEEIVKVQPQQPQGFPGGGFSHDDPTLFARAAIQKDINREMPFEKTPQELQDAIDRYTSAKARFLMGEDVDLEAARANWMEDVRKIMAFADSRGQLDVLEEAGIDPLKSDEPE